MKNYKKIIQNVIYLIFISSNIIIVGIFFPTIGVK